MKETYVKIVGKERKEDWPDTYCPIDLETKKILIGLSLIGFVPDDAEVVGVYNEDNNNLFLSSEKRRDNET